MTLAARIDDYGKPAWIAAVILATRAINYWSFLILSGVVTVLAGFGRVLNRATPELS